MKLSISNIAWTEENDEELYKFILENNFTGLEIAPTRIIRKNPYDNLGLAKDISDSIKNKYGLEISSMQSILFGKTERLFGSNEERKILIEYTKKAIDFANTIECKNLVFGSPKNRVIENNHQYQIGVEFFKELGDYALKKKTILSIEANPPIYNTNFINTTEQAIQLVKEVDSKGFMVNIDLGTIIQNDEDIDLVINHINLVNHIHISEPNLIAIKKRKIHQELASKLRKVKYDKYISIEMKTLDNLSEVKNIINYHKNIFL